MFFNEMDNNKALDNKARTVQTTCIFKNPTQWKKQLEVQEMPNNMGANSQTEMPA